MVYIEYIIEYGKSPSHESKSSFGPPAGMRVVIVMIVVGAHNYKYSQEFGKFDSQQFGNFRSANISKNINNKCSARLRNCNCQHLGKL